MTALSDRPRGADQDHGGRSAARERALRWGLFCVVVAALALVPTVTGAHLTALVARFLVYGLLAMSLDVLWGYAGQLSLGHAAFFGLAAYTTGLVLVGFDGVGMSYVAVLAGVAVPTAFGFVLGYLLFRGRVGGVYFAIVTLLVSLLLEQLAITWIGLTGGINGLFGMAPLSLGFVTIRSLESAFYLVLVVVAACFLGTRWITRTPLGLAMAAIRSNEARADSLGYSIVGVKTLAFTLSCALAGIAGMLYVPLERFVYPTQLGLVASTAVVVWVVIGGRGTLVGAFVGAFTVEYLASALSGRLQVYYPLFIGAFLVIVVLTRPGGLVSLAGTAADGFHRLRGERRRA